MVVLRPIQALRLWQQVTLSEVRDDAPDLTVRQMAILLTIYLDAPPHTVRGLAAELRVSKPAITRALDRLCDDGLLRRKTDDNDRRSVLIQRTVKGSIFLSDFAETIRRAGAGIA